MDIYTYNHGILINPFYSFQIFHRQQKGHLVPHLRADHTHVVSY